MKIEPVEILESGPGVDLSNMPDGLSVKMADPVEDFAYARNTVTLVYDLSAYEHVRLAFAALEYGDEPHEPPPNPFGNDAHFDGVAISVDGIAWYEVQDLRHLRSDRFTPYDLDLGAALAPWGLSYGSSFRIRFCQYDNNPAPMDGIFLRKIELTGDLRPPVFHLPMDEDAPSPTVHDTAAGGRHQVFLDPTGDPNTAAHSVPGPHGMTALAFDGVDDRIDFGPALLGDLVAENQDFSLAFWYQTPGDPGAEARFFFRRAQSASDPSLRGYVRNNRIYWSVGWGGGGSVALYSGAGLLNGPWHHVVWRRRGETLSLWVDGAAHDTRTDPNYARNLFYSGWSPVAIGLTYTSPGSDWPFALADLRAYDRALGDEEIVALAAAV
jgi:hypothetical protein